MDENFKITLFIRANTEWALFQDYRSPHLAWEFENRQRHLNKYDAFVEVIEMAGLLEDFQEFREKVKAYEEKQR